MDKINAILQEYGINLALMIAGGFGGLMSLRRKENLSKSEKVGTVLAGMFISNYLTPIVLEFVDMGPNYGVGFIVGFLGYEALNWVLIYVHSKFTRKNGDK